MKKKLDLKKKMVMPLNLSSENKIDRSLGSYDPCPSWACGIEPLIWRKK